MLTNTVVILNKNVTLAFYHKNEPQQLVFMSSLHYRVISLDISIVCYVSARYPCVKHMIASSKSILLIRTICLQTATKCQELR